MTNQFSNIASRAILGVIIVLVFPAAILAKREHPERWYQQKWCEAHKGQVEVVLPDGTRCDCVTETHAIEFDFGNNWAEAVGQSAYYSLQTDKKAGFPGLGSRVGPCYVFGINKNAMK